MKKDVFGLTGNQWWNQVMSAVYGSYNSEW